MKTETLATAFTAALNHIDRSDGRSDDRNRDHGGDRAAPPPAAATGDLLIDALRHSATDRDQIMLRRIGLMTAAIPGASAAPA